MQGQRQSRPAQNKSQTRPSMTPRTDNISNARFRRFSKNKHSSNVILIKAWKEKNATSELIPTLSEEISEPISP